MLTAAASPKCLELVMKTRRTWGVWGQDGLVQRRVWDLSHQLIWGVLMGEASPVSLPFFGGGERSSC